MHLAIMSSTLVLLTSLRLGATLSFGRIPLANRRVGSFPARLSRRREFAGLRVSDRHGCTGKFMKFYEPKYRVYNLHVMCMSGNTISCSSQSDTTPPREDEGTEGPAKINLNGLRTEIERGIYRTMKKLSKRNERLFKLSNGFDTSDTSTRDEIKEIELIILGLERNLKELRDIDATLKAIKVSNDPRLNELVARSAKLGVTDRPKEVQKRGPKKVKGKPSLPRLPYSRYQSSDGIEIRVGRTSADNDELSCSPQYRDDADWWLHVSGFPGSHVVIRCHDELLQSNYPDTIKDAALLAVVNSKASDTRGKQKVNLTRARNVSKPVGAKAGLVRLSGDIFTVTIDRKAESERLERLNETKNT